MIGSGHLTVMEHGMQRSARIFRSMLMGDAHEPRLPHVLLLVGVANDVVLADTYVLLCAPSCTQADSHCTMFYVACLVI